MRKIRIGTRGSALALWQAQHVAALIGEVSSAAVAIELQIIKTRGDKILDVPLARVGGKGLFVKEIEEALLAGSIDLAVHSLKDVPSDLVPGLHLSAYLEREDPRDVVIGGAGGGLAGLPRGATVGTSSLRRRCQLLGLRKDVEVRDLRGNVDTRLRRLDAGDYDAILLAAAGVHRLGHSHRISEYLPPDRFLPAVGQGVLGIETRVDDGAVEEIVAALHHEPTARCARAERSMLARLGGGCQVPIAAHAVEESGTLRLEGLIGHPSGRPLLRVAAVGRLQDSEEIGKEAAERLLAQGGDEILRDTVSMD